MKEGTIPRRFRCFFGDERVVDTGLKTTHNPKVAGSNPAPAGTAGSAGFMAGRSASTPPGRSAVPTPGAAASRAPRRRTRLRSASGNPRVSESPDKSREVGGVPGWDLGGGYQMLKAVRPDGPGWVAPEDLTDPTLLVRASWPPQQLRGVSRAPSRGIVPKPGGWATGVGRLDNLPLRAQSPPH